MFDRLLKAIAGINSMLTRRNILVSLFTLLSVVTITDGWSNQAVGEKIELMVRQLMRDIHNHNYKEILKLIPGDGLLQADARIPKKKIITDMQDKQSDLYKNLYENVTAVQIETCKESGSTLVSPNAFYEKYRENYDVRVKRLGDGEFYTASLAGKTAPVSSPTNCKFVLFGPTFSSGGNGIYMETYFFGF